MAKKKSEITIEEPPQKRAKPYFETLTNLQLAQGLQEYSTSIIKLQDWLPRLPVYHQFFLHITSKAMTSRSAPRSALTIIEGFNLSVIKTEILDLSIFIKNIGNQALAEEVTFLCMMKIFNALNTTKLFDMFMLFNSKDTAQFEESGFTYEKLILDQPFLKAFLCKPIFVAAACVRLPENNKVHQRKNMLRFLEKVVDLSLLDSIKSAVLNFTDSPEITHQNPHYQQIQHQQKMMPLPEVPSESHPRIMVRMQPEHVSFSNQEMLAFINDYSLKKLHNILRTWLYLVPELMKLLSHIIVCGNNRLPLPANIDACTIKEELLHALQQLRVYTNDSSTAKQFPFLCMLYVFNSTPSSQLYRLFKFIFSEEENVFGNQQKHDVLLNCRLSQAIFYNPLHICALLARFPQTISTSHKKFALIALKSVIQNDILQAIEPLLMQICVGHHNREGITFKLRDEVEKNRLSIQKTDQLSITAIGMFRPHEDNNEKQTFSELVLHNEYWVEDKELSLESCFSDNF